MGIFLQCFFTLPHYDPLNPVEHKILYTDWLLRVNEVSIEKFSETETFWIRLIEEAEVEVQFEKIDDWDEEKKVFVFQNDVEALRKAEKEGIDIGLFEVRKDFLEKFYSVRKSGVQNAGLNEVDEVNGEGGFDKTDDMLYS